MHSSIKPTVQLRVFNIIIKCTEVPHQVHYTEGSLGNDDDDDDDGGGGGGGGGADDDDDDDDA